jgi:uncharacterized protein (UPF0548 family)
VHIGLGQPLWEMATSAVLTWGVKTRSGFAVEQAASPPWTSPTDAAAEELAPRTCEPVWT